MRWMVVFCCFAVSSLFAADKNPDAKEDLDRASFGVYVASFADLADDFKELQIKKPPGGEGVVIMAVAPGSPAEAAGLEKYDVIQSINKKKIKNLATYLDVMKSLTPGEKYQVVAVRAVETKKGNGWKAGRNELKPVTRRESYLNTLESQADEVQGTIRCQHPDSPHYVNERTEMYLRFSEKDGKPGSLILCVNYVADDWLFIEKFAVNVDGQTFEFRASGAERDNGIIGKEAKIWEWCYLEVEGDVQKAVEALAGGKKATLRCVGRQYTKDRKLDPGELSRIMIVWKAYQIKNGAL